MATRRSSKRSQSTARDYPRTARLNELLREIIAEELERIGDDRLELLTVVSVNVDRDMRHATVYYDNLDGEDGDAETLEALADNRRALQAAVGRQARMRRTPELAFQPDPSVRSGERIDAILRTIEPADDESGAGEPVAGEPVAGGSFDGDTAEQP